MSASSNVHCGNFSGHRSPVNALAGPRIPLCSASLPQITEWFLNVNKLQLCAALAQLSHSIIGCIGQMPVIGLLENRIVGTEE